MFYFWALKAVGPIGIVPSRQNKTIFCLKAGFFHQNEQLDFGTFPRFD